MRDHTGIEELIAARSLDGLTAGAFSAAGSRRSGPTSNIYLTGRGL